jgi:hypothetical protein
MSMGTDDSVLPANASLIGACARWTKLTVSMVCRLGSVERQCAKATKVSVDCRRVTETVTVLFIYYQVVIGGDRRTGRNVKDVRIQASIGLYTA